VDCQTEERGHKKKITDLKSFSLPDSVTVHRWRKKLKNIRVNYPEVPILTCAWFADFAVLCYLLPLNATLNP